MGKGYAEGSAVEERQAALDRGGDDLDVQFDAGRAAVFGSTEEQPEQHFIGWLDDVDPDALFAAGKAWGLQVVRRKIAGLGALALPLVEQALDVPTLRVAERHVTDDAPRFGRVVVRDRSFETLALR